MKFNEKLVLNRYILSLLGYKNFEDLASEFDPEILQMLDENDNTVFYHKLLGSNSKKIISDDKLQEYDENIVRHTKTMGREIEWKYFQYLTLLFVEIYLDKFFSDKTQLLEDLNLFLGEFNSDNKLKPKDQVSPFDLVNLNKLALYNATGSGKTLLMHINLMQLLHYTKQHGIKYNKTILITPNEGLSSQHLKEFEESNIQAEIFSKGNRNSLLESSVLEIIEITKLSETESGDGKTVAVDSFEDNNLVFIDEGHRGSSGDIWKRNRDKLSENGFAFEYSATFAQAINSSAGKKKTELESEYTKAIIFDYSYKYFYNDGYGKDYSILNLDENDVTVRQTYLIASLLSFYQQMKIYETEKTLLKSYLIEKPLMVFVGSSVNAVRTESKRQVSDVVDVLLFIDEFIKDKSVSIAAIDKIMSLDSGLNKKDGTDIFAKKFAFLTSLNFDAQQFYDDMLKIIFNGSSGVLHIEDLKGADGEIGLKVGENEYFGVINVGDSPKLTKLCEANGIQVAGKEFNTQLFSTINDKNSKLNILIGSKKFSEGWSSWRVSTMGLMNVGKKEGSQIIQLFGRGVRLKGYDFCLKRSRAISGKELEKQHQTVETLNIFGLKADYMKAFKDYLKDEGVPTNDIVEFVFPLIQSKLYQTEKLHVLDLQKGKDFKKEVNLVLAYSDSKNICNKVVLSLYKQVDILESQAKASNKLDLNREILQKEHLSFVNVENVFFALTQFKNEKRWSNLQITKKMIEDLLSRKDWYQLYIPKNDMSISSFKNISRFETIIITLLKKYMKSFYEYKKSEWESQFLEYRELDKQKDRGNLITDCTITVEDHQTGLIERLTTLQNMLETGLINDADLKKVSKKDFGVFSFDRHLYNPLLYKDKNESALQIKPIELNQGEKDFVEDLEGYLTRNINQYKGVDIFLLRNQSKTGLGFFAEGNFYPDFIMWIKKDGKQYISFIDPKGLMNLNSKDDPKINLSIKIKEIEKQLNDKNIILNSFIVSVTPYASIKWVQSTLLKAELEDKNVFFQQEDKNQYIGKIFDKILA